MRYLYIFIIFKIIIVSIQDVSAQQSNGYLRINGDKVICVGQTYTYSYTFIAPPNSGNIQLHPTKEAQWSIYGAQSVSYNQNKTIAYITWGTAPGNINIMHWVDNGDDPLAVDDEVTGNANIDKNDWHRSGDPMITIAGSTGMNEPLVINRTYTLSIPYYYDDVGTPVEYTWYYKIDNGVWEELASNLGDIGGLELNSTNNQLINDPIDIGGGNGGGTTVNGNKATVNLEELDISIQNTSITFMVNVIVGCDVTQNIITEKKFIYTFPDLGQVVTDPICYGSSDATISINNIPDPRAYGNYDPFVPGHDTITFTISKYDKAPLDADSKPYCSVTPGSGGSDIPTNTIPGHEDVYYCLTGYTVNYPFKYDGSSKLITKNEIVLKDSSGNISAGIDSGLYQIQIENDLFVPYKFYTDYIETPSVVSYDSFDEVEIASSYHITTPNGTGKAEIKNLTGGSINEYYYYFNGEDINDKKPITIEGGKYYITNLDSGKQIIHITNENNCSSEYSNNKVDMKAPVALTISEPSSMPITCHVDDDDDKEDGEITFDISGGIGNYVAKVVHNSDNTTYTVEVTGNTAGFTNLKPGSYTAYVYDNSSATNYYQSVTNYEIPESVGMSTALGISLSDKKAPVCLGGKNGEILLTALGERSSYEFIFQGNTISGSSLQLDTLRGIDYTVRLKDTDHGCYTDVSFNIPEDSDAVHFNSVIPQNYTCNGAGDGQVVVCASKTGHTTEDFTYYLFKTVPSPFNKNLALRTLQNGDTFTGINAGTYTVYVEDEYNCLDSDKGNPNEYKEDNIIITQPDSLSIATDSTNAKFDGDPSGSVTVEFKGGTFPYDYELIKLEGVNEIEIETGNTTYDFSHFELEQGRYVVKVNDFNDCTNNQGTWLTDTFTIVPPDEPLALNRTLTNPICFGENGKIEVSGIGGWGDYQYSINGSPYSGNPTFTIPDGIYTISVKDKLGAIASISDTLKEPALLQLANTPEVDSVRCYGYNTGVVKLTLIGGTSPYFYSLDQTNWYRGTTINGLSAGNHIIYYKDANECRNNVSITVYQYPDIYATFDKQVAQSGIENGIITSHPQGGKTPYTFAWTANGSSEILSTNSIIYNAGAGLYDFIITDKYGCTDTSKNIILESKPGPELINISTKKPTCNGWNDGYVSFTPVNGNPNYTVDLIQDNSVIKSLASLDSNSTYSFTDLYAGNYGLQITDDWGWKNILPVSFSLDSVSLLSLDHSVTHITKYGDTDGKIIFDISGGNGFYEYILYNSSDSIIKSDTTAGIDSIINLSKGFYSFYYKDTCGCTNDLGSWIIVDSIEVIEPEPLRFTIDSIKQPDCHGEDNGYIAIHGIGGWSQSEGYSYRKNKIEWQTNCDFSNLLAGKYYIEVKDEKNVVFGDSVTVAQPGIFELATPVIISDVSCFGGDNGAINLSISGGTLPYIVNEDTVNYGNVKLSGLSQGTYNIVLKDVQGCSIIPFTETINQPTELTDSFTIIEAQDTLSNGSMYVFVQGSVPPYDIIWFNEAGDTISETDSIINFPTGTYFISITDFNGCNLLDSLYLPQLGGPKTANKIKTEITCNSYSNGVFKFELVDGHPPYDVRFINQKNDTIQSFIGVYDSIPFKISGIKPGSYTFSIVDSWKWKAKEFYTFIEPQQITVTKDITNVLICGESSGKVDFTVQGGNPNYEFVFKDVLTNIIILSGYSNGQISISGLRAGQYSLFVKDNKLCTNGHGDWLVVDNIVISQPLPLGLELIQLKRPKCFGDTNGCIEVIGKGGKMIGNNYQYKINGGSWRYFGLFNDLQAGQYILEVKDQAGAIFKDTINLSQPELLELINLDISTNYCIESNLSAVNINMNGGTAPYYYSLNSILWKKGTQVNGLSYGEHTIYVKDTNNCRITPQTIKIDKTEMLSVQFEKQLAQYGESNGWLKAIIKGGLPAYDISWYNSSGNIISNQAELTDIPSGSYFIRISDQNGCEHSQSIILDAKYGPRLVSEPVSIAVSCFGKTDGEATFSIKDGNGNYYVDVFKDGELIQSFVGISALESCKIQNLAAGNYAIQIKDSLQWYGEGSFIISSPEMIQIVTESIINPTCFGFNDASIDVNAVGGNGNYIFYWSNNDTGDIISDLSSGVYSVTVTDRLGCQGIKEFEINDPEILVVDLGADIQICLGQEYYLSTGLFASYSWSFDGIELANTRTIKVENQGEYQLIVKNENGCIASDKIVVEIRNDLLEAEFIMPSEAFVNDTVVIVDITWPAPENIYWTLAPGIVSVHSERYLEEITFTKPGIYDIMLTSRTAMCTDSIVKTILVIESEENKDETKMGSLINEFKVYPNPTNGEFTVEVNLSAISDLEVRIFNMQQNNYKLIEKYNSTDTYILNYGFMNLGTGMYIVSIQAGSEQQSKRIMIIK
ncbi:MAG: T9SS type A sorting domain-containing protein [Bacteroidales bacterium]|jgi:hypothetical protein|nr:T9SS type A sorting domain-containing protein [Bacteroidales bacterium]